jgi:trimeric autotransporter adhesin
VKKRGVKTSHYYNNSRKSQYLALPFYLRLLNTLKIYNKTHKQMKPTFTLWRGLCIVLIAALSLTQFSCKRDNDEGKENLMMTLKERQKQEFKKRVDPALGRVPTERLIAAQDYVKTHFAHQPYSAVNGITWVERGPTNIGGRTRSLVWDKNDATNKTVFAGSVGGGIWKCTDVTVATPTWTKVTDNMDNIAIDWMVQDQTLPNIMYAGTGEGWYNADGIQGYGIYKSSDGGATWAHLPSTSAAKFNYIYRIVINSAHEVFAATDGDVSKSTDGGNTWTSVLPIGTISDIAIAANGDLYAADYNSRIFKSTAANDGAVGTWVNTNYPVVAGSDRTALATAPSDANTVYAVTDANFAGVAGFYKTANAGGTWTAVNMPTGGDYTNGQGWYDLWITVDPTIASTLMCGGIDVWRSTNSGSTWSGVAYGYTNNGGFAIHPDQHIGVYRPGSTTQAIFGNDGGIYYATSVTSPAGQAINTNYNVTQFYGAEGIPTAGSNYFLAGAQDNNTLKLNNAGAGPATVATGGDGMIPHVNPLASGATQFAAYVYCAFYKSTNSGTSWTNPINNQTRGQFVNPTVFDSANNYMFGDFYDNTNAVGGYYFKWLTTGATITQCTVTNFAGAAVSSLCVSPNTADRIYFGLDNGSIVYTDAASAAPVTKTGVIVRAAQSGQVSCVAVQSGNENHILATYSNFGIQHVYETTNLGTAWTDITGNLPDIPVNWIKFYPGSTTQAVIATDLGVWSTNAINGASTEWAPTNFGAMGNVRVDMLQIRYSDNTFIAATHGRGVFTSSIANTPLQQVFFRDPILSVTEKSAGTTNGCTLGTTVVPVKIMITGQPAGTVTVNVTATATSTATPGVDYTIGSGTATFTNAAYGPQTVNVTINDNDRLDGDRIIQLSYAITSGGAYATTGNTAQQCELTIKDDETAPVLAHVQDYITDASTASLGPSAPLAYNGETSKRTQVIYTRAQLIAAGMDPAKPIVSLGLSVTSLTSTIPYSNYTVTAGTTTQNPDFAALTNFQTTTGPVTFANPGGGANWTPTLGVNYFTNATGLTFPTATQNLIVNWCFDNAGNANAGAGDACDGTLTAGNSQLRYTSTTATSACGQIASNAQRTYQPRLWLGQNIPQTVIENALNATNSNILNYNNGTVYYYNSNGKIMASISPTTTFNYGCTSVTIDRAGNSAQAFTSATNTYFVTDKTFRVIPTTNNPTGSYRITLYYTAAEKAGWEAATGNSWNAIQMVKTTGAISGATPGNPTGAGTIEWVTPTRATFGTDYTLSYTFTSGFSGFAAGIQAPIPVTLLNFTGQLQSGHALLQWTTTQELNSKQFDVERSVDGVNFVKIGTVAAAGNSNSQRRYTFVDNNMRAVNYYRLNMIDVDNRSVRSNVVLLKNDNIAQQVYVLTNPFGNYIDLQFAKAPEGKVSLRLMDMTGKQLSAGTYTNVGYNIRFNNLNMVLSKGIYVLEAEVDGVRYTYKLVRQ